MINVSDIENIYIKNSGSFIQNNAFLKEFGSFTTLWPGPSSPTPSLVSWQYDSSSIEYTFLSNYVFAWANVNKLDSFNAVDSILSSRYDTSAAQSPGQTLQIFYKKINPKSKLRLFTSSTNDYPRGLKVYTSDDASLFRTTDYTSSNWKLTHDIPLSLCSANMTMSFNDTTASVFSFEQQGSTVYYWSVHNIYTTMFPVDTGSMGISNISLATQSLWSATASRGNDPNRPITSGLRWETQGTFFDGDFWGVEFDKKYILREFSFIDSIDNNWPRSASIYYTEDASASFGNWSDWHLISSSQPFTKDFDYERSSLRTYVCTSPNEATKIAIVSRDSISGRWMSFNDLNIIAGPAN